MPPNSFTNINFTNLAVTAGVSYGLWKIISRAIRIYTSPLYSLRGPSASNFLIGNLIEITKDLSPFLEWAEKYGNVIKIKGALGGDVLYLVDPRAVNYVCSHSLDFQKPPEGREAAARLFGDDGVIFAEGNKHRQQRRIMNPTFGPSSTKELLPIFFAKAIQLRDILSTDLSRNDEREVNIISWLNRVALDVIGLAGFDYQFNSLNVHGEPNALNTAMNTLFDASASVDVFLILQALFPILNRIPTQRSKEEKKAKDIMTNIAEELVQERKETILGLKGPSQEQDNLKGLGSDLLSALVAANLDSDLPESQRMTHKEMIAQIPTFFFAGHETSSTQTTWALYYLCQRKDIQEKLYNELKGVPTDTPTADQLADLTFLDAVVRETLRVRAAVPVTVRIAMHDDVIPVSKPYKDRYGKTHKEVRIKKDEVVVIPIHAVNCVKDIWGEDAHEFNPERWSNLPEVAKDIPGVWGNTMTFLGGSRSCIGFRFALLEIKALLFTLIRSFVFELAVPADQIEIRIASVVKPYLKGDEKSGSQLPVIIRRRGD